jgi:hypothetical protein
MSGDRQCLISMHAREQMLCARLDPVRSAADGPSTGRSEEALQDADEALDQQRQLVPKELWRMIDWLSGAVHVEGLFSSSGDPSTVRSENVRRLRSYRGWRRQVHHIRECLDTGAEFGDMGPEAAFAMGESLVTFLNSLPEPVIPGPFYQECLDACVSREQSKQVRQGSLDQWP